MIVFRLLGRAIRRLVAVSLFALIRGRKAIAIAIVVLIVAWIGIANLNRLPIPPGILSAVMAQVGLQSGQNAAATRPEARAVRAIGLSAEAVPSVDQYLKGLTTFDAKLMWNALSQEAIGLMQSRNATLERLQTSLDEAKQKGARYEDITMIGNYPLQNGGRFVFYVLSRRGFGSTAAEQLEQVYFVFTVNREGKITLVQ
jgi:hypothetical protein